MQKLGTDRYVHCEVIFVTGQYRVDGEMRCVLQIVHFKIRLYCVVSVKIITRYDIGIRGLERIYVESSQ